MGENFAQYDIAAVLLLWLCSEIVSLDFDWGFKTRFHFVRLITELNVLKRARSATPENSIEDVLFMIESDKTATFSKFR